MTRRFLPSAVRASLLATGKATMRTPMRPQPEEIDGNGCRIRDVIYTRVGGVAGIDVQYEQSNPRFYEFPTPIGAAFWVPETCWISECGKYIAAMVGSSASWHESAIYSRDGKIKWRVPRSGNRAEQRQTLGWSSLSATPQQYRKHCFDVSFGDCDASQTIVARYEARFLLKIAMPRIAARLFTRVTAVRVVREGDWFWITDFERITNEQAKSNDADATKKD